MAKRKVETITASEYLNDITDIEIDGVDTLIMINESLTNSLNKESIRQEDIWKADKVRVELTQQIRNQLEEYVEDVIRDGNEDRFTQEEYCKLLDMISNSFEKYADTLTEPLSKEEADENYRVSHIIKEFRTFYQAEDIEKKEKILNDGLKNLYEIQNVENIFPNELKVLDGEIHIILNELPLKFPESPKLEIYEEIDEFSYDFDYDKNSPVLKERLEHFKKWYEENVEVLTKTDKKARDILIEETEEYLNALSKLYSTNICEVYNEDRDDIINKIKFCLDYSELSLDENVDEPLKELHTTLNHKPYKEQNKDVERIQEKLRFSLEHSELPVQLDMLGQEENKEKLQLAYDLLSGLDIEIKSVDRKIIKNCKEMLEMAEYHSTGKTKELLGKEKEYLRDFFQNNLLLKRIKQDDKFSQDLKQENERLIDNFLDTIERNKEFKNIDINTSVKERWNEQ